MRLLVDAHALLWWLGADRSLSANARQAVEAADDPLLSAGTLMEIAIKRSLGKLEIDEDWPEQARADGFGVLSVAWAHARRLQELPFPRLGGALHRDPFDRLLAAQALSEGIPIITRDPVIAAYGVGVIW